MTVPVVDRTLEPLFAKGEPDDLSSYAYRQLIGGLGLVLPVTLWLIAGWRPTEGLPRWQLLDSVSAYYYTGSVAAFVGILCALGCFLLTYRGYNNEYGRLDRIASSIAGIAAMLVAFFPTQAPPELLPPSWWTSGTGRIHFASAAVLFGSFSFFSLYLFTRSNLKAGAKLPLNKRVRNGIHIVCGSVMVGCIVWAWIATLRDAPIFLPEALALESFAVSWLVKGRIDRTAIAAVKRTLYYGRQAS